MQNASKLGAAPRFIVGRGPLSRGVEVAGTAIRLNLTVPCLRRKLLEPLREASKLILGKSRNGRFKILNAHGRIIRGKKCPGNVTFNARPPKFPASKSFCFPKQSSLFLGKPEDVRDLARRRHLAERYDRLRTLPAECVHFFNDFRLPAEWQRMEFLMLPPAGAFPRA